jgi:hypothetical protein
MQIVAEKFPVFCDAKIYLSCARGYISHAYQNRHVRVTNLKIPQSTTQAGDGTFATAKIAKIAGV